MARYKMVVLSNPTEGREAEYNEWYQNVHLKEVVTLPGIKSAQRYRLALKLGERDAYPYLAVYDIETDDVDSVLREFIDASENNRLTMSDALDIENLQGAIYEEFGPEVNEP